MPVRMEFIALSTGNATPLGKKKQATRFGGWLFDVPSLANSLRPWTAIPVRVRRRHEEPAVDPDATISYDSCLPRPEGLLCDGFETLF